METHPEALHGLELIKVPRPVWSVKRGSYNGMLMKPDVLIKLLNAAYPADAITSTKVGQTDILNSGKMTFLLYESGVNTYRTCHYEEMKSAQVGEYGGTHTWNTGHAIIEMMARYKTEAV